MSADRDLITEGRAKLAALAESPSTDRAFDLAEWAGLNLAALLDRLETAHARIAELEVPEAAVLRGQLHTRRETAAEGSQGGTVTPDEIRALYVETLARAEYERDCETIPELMGVEGNKASWGETREAVRQEYREMVEHPRGEPVTSVQISALDQTEHPLTRKGKELSVRAAELAGGQLVVFGPIAAGCLVRIHSRCLYGDVIGSDDCDCGPELERAMDLIQGEGSGVLVYLDQEGRGAGLITKARGLQTSERLGIDTFDSYALLGEPADSRCFKLAAEALGMLGLTSVRLLTSNPEKANALRETGIDVTVVGLSTEPRSERAREYQAAIRRHRTARAEVTG